MLQNNDKNNQDLSLPSLFSDLAVDQTDSTTCNHSIRPKAAQNNACKFCPKSSDTTKYKTEICRFWMAGQTCRYGNDVASIYQV